MINDRYKIKRKLGSGRSQVYICSDLLNASKDIAIKILSFTNNQKEIDVFRNEFILLKKMDHPNIIRVYEYGTVLNIEQENEHDSEIVEGSKYFTMDYIEGETLEKFAGLNDLPILKKIFEQLCSVLYYLHQSNYIYYNFNLENIIVKKEIDTVCIYLVDLLFTKYIPKNEPYEVQGVPNFIAPEILQINQVDHKADLYSLGIIFYYLIYERFPFPTDNELIIYKANIENEFEFPHKYGYEKIISITKKLLHKSPNERYDTTLQILEELQVTISNEMKNNWNSIKHFSGRGKVVYDINSIIYDKREIEVVAIRGENGSGKTLFLEELHYNHANSILIKKSDVSFHYGLCNVLLRNVFYLDNVYKNINSDLKDEIRDLLSKRDNEFIEKYKSIFLRISRENKFIVLLDDFNSYDELSIEILKEVLPILQVNGIKIVIAENTNKPLQSDFINILKIFHLHPFNEKELNDFIEKSYFKLFPKSLLKNYFKRESYLQPGKIIKSIKDLIFLDILQFDYQKILVYDSTKSSETYKIDQSEVCRLKYSQLSKDELEVINLYALFDINLDIKTISVLSEYDLEPTERIILKLINKGIFYSNDINKNPLFRSADFKKCVDDNLSSREELHLIIAKKIIEKIPDFNRIECARHFELAGEYKSCYQVLKNELESVSAKSNIAYQIKILTKLSLFPLDKNDLLEIKYLLSRALYKSREYSKCLNLTNELLEENVISDERMELLTQKGKCLVRLNECNEGIVLLNTTLPAIKDVEEKQKILIEIAQANYNLKNYSTVTEICKEIINAKQSTDELKAEAYSMIALVEQIFNNNLAGAIYNYQYAINMYERANLPYNVALMEMNIGNIIYLKDNYVEAEKHWQIALNNNEKMGDLSLDAVLLFNYGEYYFNTQWYDKAIKQYQRVENIYKSLGNNYGRGMCLANLGKVYLNTCEYNSAIECLGLAKNIFNDIDKEKYLETNFLFGQCYFYLGDTDKLEIVINHYENIYPETHFVEKHKNNTSYLKNLLRFCRENYLEIVQDIDNVIHYYKNQYDPGNIYYYAKCNMLSIRSHVSLKNYNIAKNQLFESTFKKICENNLVLRAEREYLLGMISERTNDPELNPEIEYFTKALQLIENQSIMEITCELNYAFAKYYYDLRDYKKFSEYSLITKSLINYIASKITSKEMRAKYFNSFNRKKIIEILDNMEKLI